MQIRKIGSVLAAGALLAAGVAWGQDGPAFVEARSGDPDGRMAVLIPGLASSGDVWAETAAALAAYDVRALTLTGFAGVPPRGDIAEGTPLIASTAQAVAAMLAAEDGRDVVLIGHSLGAQVALQAAALAPARVGQVIVVDSAPFYAGLVQPGATPEQAATFAQAAAAQLSALPEAAFRAQQAAGLAIYSKDPDFVAVLKEWSDASDRATIIAGFAEVAGGDFRSVLPAVRASILVLAAFDLSMGLRRDLLENVYRDQYSAAPDARVMLIDESYHFIMHDRRDAFLAALAAFLEEGA
jgi:pimeloyl-ACP methyl ester carboxylesterase